MINGLMNQTKSCFRAWTDDDRDYLRDESRRTGHADAIALPADAAALRRTLEQAAGSEVPLTFQGTRTEITGGAVPDGDACGSWSNYHDSGVLVEKRVIR